MSTPAPEKPRNWPRWAVGPEGNRAIFDCPGDVPTKWRLETPLPDATRFRVAGEPEVNELTLAEAFGLDAAPPRRGPGRPRKAATE